MELGIGELRLSPSAFWDCTLTELFAGVRGHRESINRQSREQWEQTRWLATSLITPHLKKGKRLKPSDLIKFPWENETVDPAPSKHEREESLRRIKERDSKRVVKQVHNVGRKHLMKGG